MRFNRLVLLCLYAIALSQLTSLLTGCRRNATEPSPTSKLTPERQLIKAAQQGDLKSVEKLLDDGVDVNVAPTLGITSLWQACWSGHADVAILLLQKGADPNVYDQGFQRSPLELAKDPELITLLVEEGATDAHAQLCQAALDGSSEKVKAILEGRSFVENELVFAKANAQLMRHESVAALLDAAAGHPLPSPPKADLKSLEPLVGEYRDAKLELVQIRLRYGALVLEAGGSAPQVLLPIDESTFQRGATTYRFHPVPDGSIQLETSIASRLAEVYTRDGDQERVSADEREDGPRQHDVDETPQVEDVASFDTWPQFRGLSSRGVARQQDLPTEFSIKRELNIDWIASIPGFGDSSPIVWKERLFLTTAVRESGSDKLIVGDFSDGQSTREDVSYTWKLYCLDSSTGGEVWNRVASTGIPAVGRHPKSSYANPTPVTDGSYVVALFNSGDLQCFTMKGDLVWKMHLGDLRTGAVPEPKFEWGFASSPTIHDGVVIIQCDVIDESYVAAYDLETGNEVWKTERDEPPAWGSPLVFPATGGAELVTSGSKFIRGYDLQSGRERWRLPGMSALTVPTPQYWNHHLFVASGQLPTQPILAIRTDRTSTGSDNPEIAWSHARGGPYVITPLIYQGYLYVCSTNGVLSCYEALTGQRVYRKRISRKGADSFSASPVAADGRIYFTAETGAIVEIQAGREFVERNVHSVADFCMATPAIAGGRLLVRTRHSLVAIRKAN